MTPSKKRILYVDDEPALVMLARLIFESDGGWEVFTAQSGEEASDMLRHQTVDVLLTDMRMPGMSGADLLRETMQMHPRTSRLIMSGYADAQQIAKALNATHQFIAKPCDPKSLVSIIHRVCMLDELLTDERVIGAVGQLRTVPSIPTLYFRLMAAAENPNSTLEEIASIIAQDPAMTAKILQLVNSSFFGLARTITNVNEAVSFLGLNCLRNLALSLHCFSQYPMPTLAGFSAQRVWAHSLATATQAQKVARRLGGTTSDADNAYAAGLLHDLGKIMLASELPREYGEALALSKQENIPMVEAERKIFDASHAEIGAYLLGLWGLPVSIVEAVAHHHSVAPRFLEAIPLMAVHISSAADNAISDPENPFVAREIAAGVEESVQADAMRFARDYAAERQQSPMAV